MPAARIYPKNALQHESRESLTETLNRRACVLCPIVPHRSDWLRSKTIRFGCDEAIENLTTMTELSFKNCRVS
jgi:ribosome-binding factor A